jgi:hypothetical protein
MTDNRQATRAECVLREDVFYFADFLRKNVPAFRNAFLLSTAPQTGIRETRRIKGVYTLCGAEYLAGVNYPDAVSRACHPVDIHATGTSGQRVEWLEDAAFIPYRCLIADNFPNFFVAGRAFSADEVASASARVQGSCMGMGQAAGAAAALCAEAGLESAQVDTQKLRTILTGYGANLTN